jgi:hypothetical protein
MYLDPSRQKKLRQVNPQTQPHEFPASKSLVYSHCAQVISTERINIRVRKTTLPSIASRIVISQLNPIIVSIKDSNLLILDLMRKLKELNP